MYIGAGYMLTRVLLHYKGSLAHWAGQYLLFRSLRHVILILVCLATATGVPHLYLIWFYRYKYTDRQTHTLYILLLCDDHTRGFFTIIQLSTLSYACCIRTQQHCSAPVHLQLFAILLITCYIVPLNTISTTTTHKSKYLSTLHWLSTAY